MPSVGVESGPEIVSKILVPLPGVVGVETSETNILKDRERKRHRDGHSSKYHHSTKLKEPVSSGGVLLPSVNDTVPFSLAKAGVDSSGITVGGGLRVCKFFFDKLSVELENC